MDGKGISAQPVEGDRSVEADPAVESLGGEAMVAAAKPSRLTSRLSGGAVDWTILLVLVAIWGSTYAGIKIGVETIDPFWLVAGRLSVGAISVATFFGVQQATIARRSLWAAPRPTPSGKAIVMFACVGVFCTAIPFAMYAEGAKLVDSAVMAICNGATPMFTAIFAHLFLKGDRLTWRRAIGVLLGFAGLVVLVGPEALKGAGGGVIGIALGVAGAGLYAAGNIVTRRAPMMSPVLSSIVINGAGMLVIIPMALVAAPFPVAPSAASIIALVMLGVFSTAVGMILYVWLIQRAGPMFVSLITYLSPLWATVVGVTLMGESLKWSMLGALALILVGVAVANQRMKPQVK